MNGGNGTHRRLGTFRIRDCILVTVTNDIDDVTILDLENSLTEEITRQQTSGVVIDISQLDVVDTFTGRMLGALARMSDILDARTIVVGMRPAVAITLVELGMDLRDLTTALNVDKAMQLLEDVSRR